MKVSNDPKAALAKGCGVYIFDDDNRVLLTQRGPKARHEQYKWEGPGGAVEAGETFEEAARREIREELGVDVSLGGILVKCDVLDSNGDGWEAVVFRGTITKIPAIQEPDKCVGFGWFTRDEVLRLSLADYTIKDFKHMGWL